MSGKPTKISLLSQLAIMLKHYLSSEQGDDVLIRDENIQLNKRAFEQSITKMMHRFGLLANTLLSSVTFACIIEKSVTCFLSKT